MSLHLQIGVDSLFCIGVQILVSRGRRGRKNVRLRRLAAVVAASFLQF